MGLASHKDKHEAESVGYSHFVFYSPSNVLFFELKKETNNTTKNNQTPSRGLGRALCKKMRTGSLMLWEVETHFTLGSGL